MKSNITNAFKSILTQTYAIMIKHHGFGVTNLHPLDDRVIYKLHVEGQVLRSHSKPSRDVVLVAVALTANCTVVLS